jgi:hypothetical protein
MMTNKERYEQLVGAREPFLTRARKAAALSIPSLVLPNGSNGTTSLEMPYQSLGARGVKNLASKLIMAILPPNASFFRMRISDADIEKLFKDKNVKPKIEEALSKIERRVMLELENSNIRVAANEMFQQLVVAGNVLVDLSQTTSLRMRCILLDKYVVVRSPTGEAIDIVFVESVNKTLIPDETLELCGCLENRYQPDNSSGNTSKDNVDVYTRVQRIDAKRWRVWQEINDVAVPDSMGTYTDKTMPFIPLMMTGLPGQDYGRGHVEELFGDLKSYEELRKALVQGGAILARMIFLCNPNGSTKPEDVDSAENGDTIYGKVEDVQALQSNKHADFSVVQRELESLKDSLSYAFLLNSAVQRSAERVTAEEIRYMAGELETALGGVYSTLTQAFQVPLVNIVIDRLTKSGQLPPLPDEAVKPSITTGLEALGRGQDLNKLNLFLQNLAPLGADVISKYLKIDAYMSMVAASIGIDSPVRSEAEVQQAEQQMMMMQAAQAAAPNLASNLTPNIELPTGQPNG